MGAHSTYRGPAHSQPTLLGCPTGAPPGSRSVGPTRAPHFTPVSGPTVGCPQWPHMGPYKGLSWAHNWPQWGPLYLLWACPQSAHTCGLSHWGPTWVPKCGAHTCPAFHAGIWAHSGLPARAPFGPQRSLFAGLPLLLCAFYEKQVSSDYCCMFILCFEMYLCSFKLVYC